MSAPPNAAELLQPTLTATAPAVPLLSPRATFFASFFGGPVAALAMGTVNLVRLRRARRDAWLVLAAAALALAGLAFAFARAAHPDLVADLPRALVRRVDNLLGLAAWGLFALRLRTELRAVELTGAFGTPWRVAIPAVVGALLLDFAAAVAGAAVR